ncbi:MAG: HAD family phosphatase [Burkholderiales bacterium]
MIPFDAVLFDCDGVLVDSETITNRVLRDMLEEIGWRMTLAESMAIFVGHAVRDRRALIEANTGKSFSEDWLAAFWQRRNSALEAELLIVPGAMAAVQALHKACNGRIACASGADRGKIEMQLRKALLMPYFEGRIYSGHECARNKPHPDVYLAAAAALKVDPARAAVIEDTANGSAAGLAAGATVFGYCPGGPGHDSAEALRAVGVLHLFSDMAQLPAVLADAKGGSIT